MLPRSTNHHGLALAGLGLAALALACAAKPLPADHGPDGSSPPTTPDAGPTTPDTGPPPTVDAGLTTTPGIRSFDVQTKLTAVATGTDSLSAGQAPAGQSFTMLLDTSTSGPFALIERAVVPLATTDGRTFSAKSPFRLESPGNPCGPTTVTYSELSFTVTAIGLSGLGKGSAHVLISDTSLPVAVTFTLVGENDRTAPGFPSFVGVTSDPLDGRSFNSTEPLPAGSTARLVSTTGHVIPLHPMQPDLPIPSGSELAGATLGFSLGVVPHYAETYRLVADGLTDFAGNPMDPAATPSFTTSQLPLLIAEDGFESGAPSSDHAEVFDGTTNKPAISGRRSVYRSPGGPATFRLAVLPGDTVVRFSVKVLMSSATDVFGSLRARVGAVGAPLGVPISIRPLLPPSSWQTVPGGSELFASAVDERTIPLPPGTYDEVTFRIEVYDSGCYWGSPVAQGLLLDDVRVE